MKFVLLLLFNVYLQVFQYIGSTYTISGFSSGNEFSSSSKIIVEKGKINRYNTNFLLCESSKQTDNLLYKNITAAIHQ